MSHGKHTANFLEHARPRVLVFNFDPEILLEQKAGLEEKGYEVVPVYAGPYWTNESYCDDEGVIIRDIGKREGERINDKITPIMGCYAVSSADDVMKLVSRQKPNAVVCPLHTKFTTLPDEDGVLAGIKKVAPRIPLVVTVGGDPEEVAEHYDKGLGMIFSRSVVSNNNRGGINAAIASALDYDRINDNLKFQLENQRIAGG